MEKNEKENKETKYTKPEIEKIELNDSSYFVSCSGEGADHDPFKNHWD